MTSLTDQLVRIYLDEEGWHKSKLSEDESKKYFDRLIEKKRIFTIQTDDGTLIGYFESWRVNFEQFGRIVCSDQFSAYSEDVETGNICYLANVWIKKEFRDGNTYKLMKAKFIEQNYSCEYFVGEARRKSCAPLKVFKRKDFLAKYMAKELKNG